MNKEQAIAAISRGATVKHRYFGPGEYIQLCPYNSEMYQTDDGYDVSMQDFWATRKAEQWQEDWELVLFDSVDSINNDVDGPRYSVDEQDEAPMTPQEKDDYTFPTADNPVTMWPFLHDRNNPDNL